MEGTISSASEYCWGHDLSLVGHLYAEILCRNAEIDTLLSLFGEIGHTTPSSIFIYGHTATGKTFIISKVMTTLQLPSIFVNCVECYSSRYLFEHLLSNLPAMPGGERSEDSVACDNLNDFVRLLKQEVVRRKFHSQTIYFIIDKAERLRDMDVNILPAFLRLQELTGLNVCTILLSEIVWEKFRFGTGFNEPVILYLQDYSQDDLIKIMVLDCPEDVSIEVYRVYVGLFLSVFYHVCRDLRELRHLALLNFPKYMEPIHKGEATEQDVRKLWRNIEPHLKKALQTVYLREVSSIQWEQMQEARADEGTGKFSTMTNAVARCHVELPYYSKYLLVAAYLASYNPSTADRRFFCKNAGKLSKRSKLLKKRERASNHLLGPKPFPMDRLLAIFYSIVEDKISPSANIFSQISSLLSLQLLGQTGGDNQIEMPRYKCLVSLDFIRSLARTIGFDLMKYLYDFI